jgi:hypothetical protein
VAIAAMLVPSARSSLVEARMVPASTSPSQSKVAVVTLCAMICLK